MIRNITPLSSDPNPLVVVVCAGGQEPTDSRLNTIAFADARYTAVVLSVIHNSQRFPTVTAFRGLPQTHDAHPVRNSMDVTEARVRVYSPSDGRHRWPRTVIVGLAAWPLFISEGVLNGWIRIIAE